MKKLKSIFSKDKVKLKALVSFQIMIGLFVGNYFLRPALVTTAVVSTTVATSSIYSQAVVGAAACQTQHDTCSASASAETACKRKERKDICDDRLRLCNLAVAATTSAPTTSTTGTGAGTAPSALTFTGSPYTYTVGTAITTNTPTVTGTITNCTANPALPAGLSIAATTCAISGTPTASSTATAYTITATNATGNTTANINITVNAASCTTCKMFFTATNYDGNLGGFTGADAKCNSDASKPAGGGNYKAFLTDVTTRRSCTTSDCSGGASEGLDWVLKANTQYTRADGTIIGTTNAGAIFAGAALTNPVKGDGVYTEFRTGFRFVTTANWLPHATANCASYTSATGNGVSGNLSSAALSTGGGSMNNFLYTNGTTCATAVKLLCVEQ